MPPVCEYGSLWDDDGLVAENVEVIFHPNRWAGTLKYKGVTKVSMGKIYTLKMSDGASARIDIQRSSSVAPTPKGALQVEAAFNPAHEP